MVGFETCRKSCYDFAKNNNIRMAGTEIDPMFCITDIQTYLEMTNIHTSIGAGSILKKEKKIIKNLLYLNLSGLKRFLVRSRMPKVGIIACALGMEVDNLQFDCLEASAIQTLTSVFHRQSMQFSFPVGPYRIDLYFDVHKIAVEFDEAHHNTSTNIKLDKIREQYIVDHIQCRFVRCRINREMGSLTQTIARLIDLIYPCVQK